MSRGPTPVQHQDRTLRLRRGLLLGFLLLGAVAVLSRAFHLQALERERWVAEAAAQHRERIPLPARRGTIYDRDGVPLALTYETYRVSIAPGELASPSRTTDRLGEVLGLSRATASRATARSRRWVVLPGRYTAEQRERLGAMPGVYFERQLERFYPQGTVGREIIGVVSADGRALGGVEQQFDDLLRGEPGYSVLRRDARGDAQPAISLPVARPRDGADVYLTIDLDLQEIADVALRDAIQKTNASGGDLLLLDPRTGEVLAAASRRARSYAMAAFTEPYEPGSTLKPFVVATLLAERRASLSDSVFAENGRWRTGRRTITDSHPEGWLSLADVIRVSSNVGIVKFAERLTPGQQYSYLRDFGFGTPTGVEFPAESSGRLRRPAQWSKLSAASLAMGYELAVTPLQLAAAYGALANGGVLMEPHLLREIRVGGRSARREPRVLRRVVPAEVAETITEVLISVVEEGTATRASWEHFRIAGKTGTARRTGPGGRYQPGSYTASFVSYFPAEDPQIVLHAKIDEPRGDYYGGLTAAPVTRETLQAMVAARTTALDRRSLLATRLPSAVRAEADLEGWLEQADREGTYVFSLRERLPANRAAAAAQVRVPEVAGLSPREAAAKTHAAGLRVRLRGTGSVRGTIPAAGAALAAGDTVLLLADPDPS